MAVKKMESQDVIATALYWWNELSFELYYAKRSGDKCLIDEAKTGMTSFRTYYTTEYPYLEDFLIYPKEWE